MTAFPLRALPLILICLALNACSLVPMNFFNSDEINESRLFYRAFDEYLTTGDPARLELVAEIYPQGKWRSNSEGLLEMIAQSQEQQRLLAMAEENLAACVESQASVKTLAQAGLKKELARCQQEKNALKQDTLILEDTLSKLKDVLIDTEQQAK